MNIKLILLENDLEKLKIHRDYQWTKATIELFDGIIKELEDEIKDLKESL